MLTVDGGRTGTAPGTTVLTLDGALGRSVSDLDFSRAHLNYLRFYTGWLPGEVSGGLGQASDAPETYEEALAQLAVYRGELEAQRNVAELKYTEASRTWMIIGGLVGVAGLALSLYQAFRKD